MYGYYSKGQIRRSLHQDDIDGIVFIYGGVSGYSLSIVSGVDSMVITLYHK